MTRQGVRIWLTLVVAVYAYGTVPHLTTLPRVNVDEPWLLERAYHVIQSGVPKQPMFLLDHAYLLQPGYSYILAPWLRLFGVGILQARLLSVLMGLGAVLLTFKIGCLLVGPAGGVIAAAFLATDSNFLGGARYARTDTPALFFVTVTLFLFYWSVIHESRRAAFLSGVACGVAMLCHGNSYWVAPIVAASYLVVYGARALTKWPPYLWAAGAVTVFGPYVVVLMVKWEEFRRQVGIFAAERVPSLNPRTIAYYIGQEPQRYHDWYFGLITGPVANPVLRTFQVCTLLGAVVLMTRLLSRRGPAVEKRQVRWLTILTFGSVLIFAGFIPNKALVYIPNLLIGFALLAGLAVSTVARRLGKAEPVMLWVWLIVFNAGAVLFYAHWYLSMLRTPLVPYEETTRILKTLVPESRKYLLASAAFWLPFHDDPTVRFISRSEMGPYDEATASQGRNSLYRLPADRDLYVLVDDANFGFALASREEDLTWRTNWRRYLSTECTVRAMALGTAYGDIALFQCGRAARSQHLELLVDRRARYRIDRSVWSADPEAIERWKRFRPDTRVVREAESLHVTSEMSGGLVIDIPVRPGNEYLLDIRGEDRLGTALVSTHSVSASGALSNGQWAALTHPDWLPSRLIQFKATQPTVRAYMYSERGTDFVLQAVTVRLLSEIPSPQEHRFTRR